MYEAVASSVKYTDFAAAPPNYFITVFVKTRLLDCHDLFCLCLYSLVNHSHILVSDLLKLLL